MKIQELVEKYKKNQRIDIAKELDVKPYVSIAFKREMAQLVLDNCTTVVDGEIHIDSVERYILFTIAVIGMHTNLEFAYEDDQEHSSYEDDQEHSSIDDYDALCESGLLVKIIDTFKDDYASCQEILNMMTADRMQGGMTIEKKIGNFLDGIQGALGDSLNKLVEKLNPDNLLGDLPIDQNKLLELYNSVK